MFPISAIHLNLSLIDTRRIPISPEQMQSGLPPAIAICSPGGGTTGISIYVRHSGLVHCNVKWRYLNSIRTRPVTIPCAEDHADCY